MFSRFIFLNVANIRILGANFSENLCVFKSRFFKCCEFTHFGGPILVKIYAFSGPDFLNVANVRILGANLSENSRIFKARFFKSGELTHFGGQFL